MSYLVSEVYATLQGEGRLAGTPVILLRLQGCAVGCPWCDTKHSWTMDRGALREAEELARTCLHLSNGERWVMLTGGEPCEQAPLRPLVEALRAAGFRVMLETSGTAELDCPELIEHLCVSPKAGMPGGRALMPEVVRAAHEVKCVVGKDSDITRAVELAEALQLPAERISLQPLGGERQPATSKATRLCIEAARRLGYRVSLQTHKMLDIP